MGLCTSILGRDQVASDMQLIIHAFDGFCRRVNADHGSGDATVCVVWYKDGEREEVSRHMFVSLIHEHTWRTQVTAIQSYVHPKKTHTGTYETTLNRYQRHGKASLVDRSSVAMNAVTQSLAQFTERAYVVAHRQKQESYTVGGARNAFMPNGVEDGAQGVRGMGVVGDVDDSGPRMSVSHMNAHFVVDCTPRELLWLTHCTNVYVRVIDDHKQSVLARHHTVNVEASSAATAVGNELVSLTTNGLDPIPHHASTHGVFTSSCVHTAFMASALAFCVSAHV